jgi:hypothetical protein
MIRVVTEILDIFHPLRLKTQVSDEEIWLDKGLTLGVSKGFIRIGFVIFPFHPKSKLGTPSETCEFLSLRPWTVPINSVVTRQT